MKNKITVVDVTLRDGGYANNYGFTTKNVQEISGSLDNAGVKFVEIGHGYGLGAERVLDKMAQTDKEYIDCLKGHLKKAKFGMFAMAGICTVEDINQSAKQGMDFIRIGSVHNKGDHGFEKAIPLLKCALDNNMWGSSNLLKVNIYSPKEVVKVANKLERIGIENVYLVDSSGGMLPEQVSVYVKLLKKETSLEVGLHAHQNLSLGVANSVAAVQAGATFVDGTLLGIGRDAGNAQLETLIAIFNRMNYNTGVDLYKLFNISKNLVKPIIPKFPGVEENNLMLGYACMHTLALEPSIKLAEKYGFDWRDFLLYLQKSKLKFEDPVIIEELAKRFKSCKK